MGLLRCLKINPYFSNRLAVATECHTLTTFKDVFSHIPALGIAWSP